MKQCEKCGSTNGLCEDCAAKTRLRTHAEKYLVLLSAVRFYSQGANGSEDDGRCACEALKTIGEMVPTPFSVTDISEEEKAFIVQRDLAEMEVWQAARSVRAIADELFKECDGSEALRYLCSALDSFDALIAKLEGKAEK
jgi:hypothetical protein